MLLESLDIDDFEDFDGHEAVYRCLDSDTGLEAYIGIHNRQLGPALGGCRIWPYANSEAAISDVLRLSRGMTYKSALAGLPLGGGKAVIVGNPANIKTPARLRSMGRFVESLGGRYITAEDSGTTVSDLEVMAIETRHVSGISRKNRGGLSSGDPSPVTAMGVFVGMQAAARRRFGTDDLRGIRVAVQGVGNVGGHLVALLVDAGARVIVSDINIHRTDELLRRFPVTVMPNDLIHRQDVEIFSPCALGGSLNCQSLDEIQAPVIAGAANNQLRDEAASMKLFRSGRLYAPDYVINAGGIIDIWYEQTGYDYDKVMRHTHRIADTLEAIFDTSEQLGLPTDQIADRMAEERFQTQKLVNVA
ncbi:MAG: Glu/Leu/Phe/Val dehydrogenase [Pseudomonadales bacterium]|nr:Glu/Leu/Phe/Val dehydrogenase [Pseudomonadales bacterium]